MPLNRRSFAKLLAFSAPVLGSKTFSGPEVHLPKPSRFYHVSGKVEEGPYIAGENIKAGSIVFIRDGKVFQLRGGRPRGSIAACANNPCGVAESDFSAGASMPIVTAGLVNVRFV